MLVTLLYHRRLSEEWEAAARQLADELGIAQVVEKMDALHTEYLDDRYRCSPLLRKMAREGSTFFNH